MTSQPTSVLMGRAKNEALYLIDWIAYHKVLGFTDIVIFSNPSGDTTNELLNRLQDFGIVKHVEYVLQTGESPDREMGRELIKFSQALERDWVCMLDIDEYLVLRKHESVSDFLKDYEDFDGVAINWQHFGSSGAKYYADAPTINRFLNHAEPGDPINRWVKSFARSAGVIGGGPHYFHMLKGSKPYAHASGQKFTNYADIEAMSHDVAQVNHYAIRSKMEYVIKKTRGDGQVNIEDQESVNRYSDIYFSTRDKNECFDDSVLKNSDKVEMLSFAYRQLPGVGDCEQRAKARFEDKGA